MAKFSQNGNNMLVEGNPKDYCWGAGLSIHNPKIWNRNAWLGYAQNNLGKFLHEVRKELKRA